MNPSPPLSAVWGADYLFGGVERKSIIPFAGEGPQRREAGRSGPPGVGPRAEGSTGCRPGSEWWSSPVGGEPAGSGNPGWKSRRVYRPLLSGGKGEAQLTGVLVFG